MNNKRGQAALEFLMTYGWAILVVLIAIGAIEMVIQNGMGISLTSFSVGLQNSGSTCDASPAATDATFSDGETIKLTITCALGTDTGAAGDRFKGNLQINWTEGSGANALTRTKNGQIVGTIE